MTQTSEGFRPPAGWYPDPGGAPGQRWWDGTAWTAGFQPAVAGLQPPPPPRRRWSPWVVPLAVVALVGALVVGLLVALGGSDEPPVGPGGADPGGGAPASGVTTDYLLSLIGSDASSEAISALDRQCGSNIDRVGNLECPSLGFEITFDPSLTATRVILYPFQENSMAEYTGALPGGVAWADSYPDLVARLGEPVELEGGFGAIDITAHYRMDGYDVGYGLDTWYNSPEYLQNAHLTSITIQPL
jgi:hypothetical protein